MIDHMCITVSDLAVSRAFYSKTLAPLGYRVALEMQNAVGFGVYEGYGQSADPAGEFWLSEEPVMTPRLHLAFSAESRAVVDAFFDAGVAAGSTDNGAPGMRPQYHDQYYAAFILDPDGYNIEAVFHKAKNA
jgi:catechol 2,3-dioxygenase-like lactoylglutathione lyase family enzyme